MIYWKPLMMGLVCAGQMHHPAQANTYVCNGQDEICASDGTCKHVQADNMTFIYDAHHNEAAVFINGDIIPMSPLDDNPATFTLDSQVLTFTPVTEEHIRVGIEYDLRLETTYEREVLIGTFNCLQDPS